MLDRKIDDRANFDSLKRAYDQSIATPPTFSQSIFDHFSSSLFSESLAVNDIEKILSNAPKNDMLQQAYDIANLDLDNPNISLSKKIIRFPANFLADTLGYTLGGPIGLLGGLTGGVIGESIESGVKAIAPEILPSFIKTAGRIAAQGNKSALEVSGFLIPESVQDAYDKNKNDLSFRNLAESISSNYGIGFSLGSVGYAAGIIWSKTKPVIEKALKVPDHIVRLQKNTGLILNESLEEEPIPLPSDKNKNESLRLLHYAFNENRITKEEHEYYKNFLINPNDPRLEEKAAKILLKSGHPVDAATNRIHVQALAENTIKNLNSVVGDALTHDMPEQHRNSLVNYIINSSFEQDRQHPFRPNLTKGLKGFVNYADSKIIEQEKRIKELDKSLDKTLYKNIKKKMPLSQKKIFKEIKQANFEKSYVSNLPYTLPSNMVRKSGQARETSLNLLSPKEEIKAIRKSLLGTGKLHGKFHLTKHYERLKDISKLWPGVKDLLTRVHLQHDFEKQKSMRNIIESMRQVLNSDIKNLSNADNVKSYLQYRIEDKMPSLKIDGETPSQILKKTEIPQSEKESRVEQLKKSINIPNKENTISEEKNPSEHKKLNLEEKKEIELKPSSLLKEGSLLREETESYVAKLDEFKEKESVFSNLIKCLIGSSNGEV